MAKANASAKLTGGRGFCYEDLVAARFLLGMLGAVHPLGPDLGQLLRIDWQTGDAGCAPRRPRHHVRHGRPGTVRQHVEQEPQAGHRGRLQRHVHPRLLGAAVGGGDEACFPGGPRPAGARNRRTRRRGPDRLGRAPRGRARNRGSARTARGAPPNPRHARRRLSLFRDAAVVI